MSAIVFNSNEIKMFPSQTRSDQYDRKARFATDTNIANIGMSLTNKQGFVIRGCVVDANGANLTLQGSDTFHSIWLGGNVFNINRATIALPTKKTTDNSLLISGDVAAFHIKWMNGSNALPSGQIGVIGQLKNGVGESTGKYGGLELVAMKPNQMVGEGDFYAPVATYDGTKWVAHETAMHKYEAKDITVRPSETPTAPSTGAEGEQSLEQFLEFNTIIDDGGLVAESGKQLNRLQLKRASHTDIVDSESVNIKDGEIIIDKDRNYLLRGKNGLPKTYKPFVTNEVLGYANELSPDGNTYTASASPTGQFRLYGANTEVRLDVAQGTPWKIRSGTEEDVVADNVEINPTITLKRSKLILEKGLKVTGAPDFSMVNTAFNRNYNTSAGHLQKDGTASVGSQNLTARADHVHPLNVDDDTAPSTQAVGDTAEVGEVDAYARLDHKHGMPAFASATKKDGQSGSGIDDATTIARSNHSHSLNVDSTSPEPLSVGGSAAVGSASAYARRDHKHKMPGLVTTTSHGFMDKADKARLDGIESGANKYIHPSANAYSSGFYKIKVNDLGHVTEATAVTLSDITALGTLPMSSGGTGATSASAALSNLGGIPRSGSTALEGIFRPNTNGGAHLGIDSRRFGTGYFSGKVTANEFNADSDIRLKDNIIPCQTKDISQVNVKEYDLKGAKGRHIGVIAQELREHFPELVCEENNKMKTLSVKESKLVYYLMDEVRRLKAELREKNLIG